MLIFSGSIGANHKESSRKTGAIVYYDAKFCKKLIQELPAQHQKIIHHGMVDDFLKGSS